MLGRIKVFHVSLLVVGCLRLYGQLAECQCEEHKPSSSSSQRLLLMNWVTVVCMFIPEHVTFLNYLHTAYNINDIFEILTILVFIIYFWSIPLSYCPVLLTSSKCMSYSTIQTSINRV